MSDRPATHDDRLRPPATLVGRSLASFTLIRKLGSGGMGSVYLGIHSQFGHRAALKVLPSHPPPNPEVLKRFYREAKALSTINHPNIVRVTNWGNDGPLHFIQMQYVNAASLSRIVEARGAAPALEALRVIRVLADAMACAHEHGVIHRDLKPANILYVEATGELKVVDFGLAKLTTNTIADESVGPPLTLRGQIIGTPAYMAPEQASGDPVTKRSDIYSLGGLLFFLLTGLPPVSARNAQQAVEQVQHNEVRQLHRVRRDLPLPFARLVHTMMAHKRTDRFAAMGDVRTVIDRALEAGKISGSKAEQAAAAAEAITAGMDELGHTPIKFDTGDNGYVPRPRPAPRNLRPGAAAVSDNGADDSVFESDYANLYEEEEDESSYGSMPPTPRRPVEPENAPTELTGAKGPARRRTAWLSLPAHLTPAPAMQGTHHAPATNGIAPVAEASREIRDPDAFSADSTLSIPDKLGFAHDIRLEQADAAQTGTGDKTRIGPFTLNQQIGLGGMGTVLSVHDLDLNRDVAIKIMRSSDPPRDVVNRFLVEAQVTGQLEHPNIVPVHALGLTEEQQLYFVMKYVRGESLFQILANLYVEAFDDPTVYDRQLQNKLLDVFLKVCDAVGFAHSRGVIHRDLKPDNVMVGEFGEVQVMDWGLAKVRGVDDPNESKFTELGGRSRKAEHETPFNRSRTSRRTNTSPLIQSAGASTSGSDSGENVSIELGRGTVTKIARRDQLADDIHKTLDGMVLGTPAYMPPEQADGRVADIDHRSDIYSLGAILFHILALNAPFDREDGVTPILQRVVTGRLPSTMERANGRRIPPELDAVVRKAMARKQRDRYQTVQALQADIRAYLEGQTVSAAEYTLISLFRKWLHRHRVIVRSAAAVLLVVAISIGIYVQRAAEDRADQVDKSMADAADAERMASEAESRGDLSEAEQNLAAAISKLQQADDLDPNAFDEGDEAWLRDLRDRQISIRTTLRAQQQEQGRRLAAEQQTRENRRRAQENLVLANERLADAEQRLTEKLNQLSDITEDEIGAGWADESWREIAAIYDDARSLLSIARDLTPGSDSVDDAWTRAITATNNAEQQWTERVDAREQDRLAVEYVESAQVLLQQGQRQLAEIKQQPSDTPPDEANRRVTEALDNLMRARDQYKDALRIMDTLRGGHKKHDEAITGQLSALISLAEMAIHNEDFRQAQYWIGLADELCDQVDGGPAMVVALRAAFDEQNEAKQQYDRYFSDGRQSYQAGNYQQAIDAFRNAREHRDTDEVREQIRQAEFANALTLAESAAAEASRLDDELSIQRWKDAERLAAGPEPTTEEEVGRKESKLASIRDRAATDLLRRARAQLLAIDTGAPARAERLADAVLHFRPANIDAAEIVDQIRARRGTPTGYVFIPPGPVSLGSPAESDNNPERDGTLSGFYIAIHEVSVRRYRDFVAAGGYQDRQWWSDEGWAQLDQIEAEGAARRPMNWAQQITALDRPVVGVSWFEAQAYARWRTAQEPDQPEARLPTDDEWELVARFSPATRTSNDRIYPWGAEPPSEIFPPEETLHVIGNIQRDVTPFGLHDLGGNASEWVGPSRLGGPDTIGVRGTSTGLHPSKRQALASTRKRGYATPDYRSMIIGFRLVRDRPAPSPTER